ncbi:short-chain collagen C4-like isoform X1 [Dreissena polymorpha]|uniref:Short-chain collagen C4-like n=1 Tax=Dreissena polymorpha TaxID=45954 RepID=A0A9D4ENL0_DREPO|nr:short-chain collagen C4-like isoform X1 [Dreissena polymorpha]XP_052226553.1 short-chain collagen C4-like isoform X1 [Dreissena polymorpha]XP_052226554.1 short-chain collagen C4-like isoform X1 [Dreissena polymorpha]XP_052226556.1 short-chain collagen C4-like isoform X1 [Dreissena polymorpha]XP_052226557.1 short-chain collagen C4-like isoform X1 [Dreissena polymorpha]XP_052226558.1 short-chain collagen C4-like isoform X1 [Dreissena polymorpha]KAH3783567.1 hypothetical protein DPMN_161509 [
MIRACPWILSVMFLIQNGCTSGSAREPACSRFHYEEQLLEKMIRAEIHVESVDKKLQQYLAENLQSGKELKELSEKLNQLTDAIRKAREHSGTSGTTYVRWGRKSCPTIAALVYEGFTAGSYYGHTGSGANYLCLPAEPLWGVYDDGFKTPAIIYGTEYETSDSPVFNHLHEHEVPCAVCRVSTSNVLMVPGRNACYTGWTLEYAGYLMAERNNHASNKNFVCVDGDAEVTNCSSGGNENGALLYVVESSCNPLKCPPYVSGRELTCAVCSYKE